MNHLGKHPRCKDNCEQTPHKTLTWGASSRSDEKKSRQEKETWWGIQDGDMEESSDKTVEMKDLREKARRLQARESEKEYLP